MPKVIQLAEAALSWHYDKSIGLNSAEISRKQAFRIIDGFGLKKVFDPRAGGEIYSNHGQGDPKGTITVSGSRTAWEVHVADPKEQDGIAKVAR